LRPEPDFRYRRLAALADGLDDVAGGAAVLEVQHPHLAAVGGDFGVAGDIFRLALLSLSLLQADNSTMVAIAPSFIVLFTVFSLLL